MHEGSRNKNDKQSAGIILLSSGRATCMGCVGGASSSDSIHFTSNLASCCLTPPFVFWWRSSICPAQSPLASHLSEGSPRCLYPSSGQEPILLSSSDPSPVFQPAISLLRVHRWYPPVAQLVFWPESAFCCDKKACFARRKAVKLVKNEHQNLYMTRS